MLVYARSFLLFSEWKSTFSTSTLTVPNTVAGLPVLEIGAQAFEGNTKLKSVTLPATIEIIGRRAFAECKNLLEVK